MTQPERPPSPFTILLVCTANICRSPMAEYLLRAALDRRSREQQSGKQQSAEQQGAEQQGAEQQSGDQPGGGRSDCIQVVSAGTRGFDDAPMDPPAAEQLRRLGGDPSDFRSRSLTNQMCEQADLILTATRAHRAFVLERVPRALRRTFTLREFAEAAAMVRRGRPDAPELHDTVRLSAASRGAVTLTDADYDVLDPYGAPVETHRRTADGIHQATESIATSLVSGIDEHRNVSEAGSG